MPEKKNEYKNFSNRIEKLMTVPHELIKGKIRRRKTHERAEEI
jgi:hypothetical protein